MAESTGRGATRHDGPRLPKHAIVHWCRRGQHSSEVTVFRVLLCRLVRMCGKVAASELSPLKLQRVCQSMIGDGWTHNSIN